jgi:hypothetical protein
MAGGGSQVSPPLLAFRRVASDAFGAGSKPVRERAGQHQPLNRRSERFAREGIDLGLSTLADLVGAATAALQPLHNLIDAHVMAAIRLHGDDTTVPVPAKGKTDTGRIWVYVRDDRPFGADTAPAAAFRYSRDRRGEHPEKHLEDFDGVLQADAFAGYNRLYAPDRKARADHRRAMPGAWPTRENPAADFAPGVRSGETHRRRVRP